MPAGADGAGIFVFFFCFVRVISVLFLEIFWNECNYSTAQVVYFSSISTGYSIWKHSFLYVLAHSLVGFLGVAFQVLAMSWTVGSIATSQRGNILRQVNLEAGRVV